MVCSRAASPNPVGGVGTTGNSTGCHLHFEVMENGQTVDPAPFI
ncbi:M23 family metallopeptidase [Arthrobacter roseus]|nr:M23 family metallopeptidase [Arthrobacter roseus]